jgi:lipopolysaccharide transport system permease protein
MQAGAIFVSIKRAEAAGLAELLNGAWHWRLWHLLGARELRQRYARSRLGQLWLVLSAAIMIAVMSMAWSLLSSQPLGELVPFIGAGFVILPSRNSPSSEAISIFRFAPTQRE